MSEEDRIKKINEKAAQYLGNMLAELEETDVDEDNFAAKTYATIVVAYLLGYAPDVMIADAKKAADRLLELSD